RSERLERNNVERLTNDQLAHLGVLEHVGEQIPDVQHLAESLEDLHEATVLALGEIGVDDVVVEEIGARTRRHGEELIARAVHEHGAQRADFGGDVDWHSGKREAGSGDYGANFLD